MYNQVTCANSTQLFKGRYLRNAFPPPPLTSIHSRNEAFSNRCDFFKTPLLKLFPKVSIFTNFPLSILVGMKNKDKQDKKGNHSVSKKHSAYMGLWPQNKDVVKILPQRRMIFFTKWCFSLSSVRSSIHVRNQVPKDQLSENRRPISTHWRLALLRETAGYHNR